MSASRGLLGRLSSPDPRRRPDVLDEIVVNVASILNTHEGDGHTCADMGCDFVGLMSRWPTSETDVLAAVRRTVETYEPRLRNVQVRRISHESYVVALEITAELRGPSGRDRVRLHTEISPEGRMKVG